MVIPGLQFLYDRVDITIGSAIAQELALKDVVGVGRVGGWFPGVSFMSPGR